MSNLNQIAKILKEYSLQEMAFNLEEIPLLKKIIARMESGKELEFILPAFPAKSPSQKKTSGELPDFGEVLALKNLQNFCDRISDLYSPGAKLIICSDGRVFSDVVKVSDDSIDRYNEGVKEIIQEYQLHSLSVFDMDDLYPSMTPTELRQMLLGLYAQDLASVKEQVKTDESYCSLFNGIHRFLFEDAAFMRSNQSKNAIRKETKELAYELLRRSDAWSNLLNVHFKDALRLSIHPHSLDHEKFGIKLVPSSNRWATPWHNVVVKIKNRFELMHKSEALALNATFKLENKKYAYFEVPTI